MKKDIIINQKNSNDAINYIIEEIKNNSNNNIKSVWGNTNIISEIYYLIYNKYPEIKLEKHNNIIQTINLFKLENLDIIVNPSLSWDNNTILLKDDNNNIMVELNIIDENFILT